ncbi:MAG: PAS domain S-box protein [Saprospiraceae bacterium]|nr:PAS domain S-box protein [Saprospiraceae bacterium]
MSTKSPSTKSLEQNANLYQQLHQKKRMLDLVEHLSNTGSWELDLHTGAQIWSDNYYKICGLVPQEKEASNALALELVHPDDRERTLQTFYYALDNGLRYDIKKRLIRPDGEIIYVHSIATPEFDAYGKVSRFYGTLQDITKRLKTEKALIEGMQRYNLTLEAARDGLWEWDLESDTAFFSPRFKEMFGLEAQIDVEGVLFFNNRVHPDDRDRVLQALTLHFKHNEPFLQEFRMKDHLGVYNWFLVRAQASWNEEGRATRMAGSITDISESKKKQKLLEDTEEVAKIGSWELDFAQNKITWNETMRQIHEVSDDFVPDLNYAERFFKEGAPRDRMNAIFNQAILDGEDVDVELEFVTAKGNERWKRLTIRTEKSGDIPVRMYGICQDITDRKHAEQTLMDLLAEKNTILESITDGFCTINRNWVVTYWNRAAEVITTLPREKVLGKNMWKVYGDAKDMLFYKEYYRAMDEHVPVHFEEYYPIIDKWLEISAYPSEIGLSVYFKDISQTRHLLQLQQLEQQVLEMNIKKDSKIEDTIHFYLTAIEQLHPNMFCSIQKLRNNRLYSWVSIRLPKFYLDSIEGIEIGPEVGSCGTAAYTKQTVIASDIGKDPLWASCKSFALEYNLRSCWSIPIFDSNETIVGTFAMYHPTPKSPNVSEMQTITRARNILQIIIENKAIEQNLKLSNERFEYATQATSDAIWDFDLQNNTLYWGDSYADLFGNGIVDQQTNLQYWIDRIHEEDRVRVLGSLQRHIQSEIGIWYETYRYMRANGQFGFVSDKGVVIRDKHGNGIRMIGAMQDITRQKEEEQQMKLLESVITNAKDAIMIMEISDETPQSAVIIYVNEAFTSLTGYTSDEIKFKKPRILLGPLTDEAEIQRVNNALKSGQPIEVELINYRKNGETFWNNCSIVPNFNPKGQFTHVISIQKDVTERKIAEAEQETFNLILRAINQHESLDQGLQIAASHLAKHFNCPYSEAWSINFNATRMMFRTSWMQDTRFRIMSKDLSLNNVTYGQGLIGSTLQHKNILYWETLGDRPFLRKEVAKKEGIVCAVGIPIFFKDEVIAVFCLYSEKQFPFSPENNNLLNTISKQIGVDIQKNRTDDELNHFFTLSPDIMCIISEDGYFKKINPALIRIMESTEFELLAHSIKDFVHPDDKAHYQMEIHKTKELITSLQFENRFVTKTGKVVWFEWEMIPLKSEGLIYAVAKDITQKKAMDEEKKQLIEALTNNNRELKQFSYITSHNLRSPLTNMLSVFDLLDLEHITHKETIVLIDALKKSTLHLNNTLNDLIDILIVKGNTNLTLRSIQFARVYQSVTNSIQHLIDESGAIIEIDFHEAPEVVFNVEYLESIFLNLLTNSIKYSKKNENPKIKIYSYMKNKNIHLNFEDQGLGFDLEKVKDRIFGLYQKFHTHKDSKGIGLYLVHSQITALGGSIAVESKPLEGTKFTICFKPDAS